MALSEKSLEELYQSLKQITNDPTIELFEDKLTKVDLSDNSKTRVQINNELKKEYLTPTNILPWSILDVVQQVPEMNSEDYDYKEFLTIPQPIARTAYYFKRKGIEGKIHDFKEEVTLREIANANASNSLSLTRSVNHHGNTIRGSTQQLPFTPGGLSMQSSNLDNSTKLLHKDQDGLFDIPDGLSRGIIPHLNESILPDDSHFIDLSVNDDEFQQLNQIDNSKEIEEEIIDRRLQAEELTNSKLSDAISKLSSNNISKEEKKLPTLESQDKAFEDIDALLPADIDFGRSINANKNIMKRKEWAHVVDLNHKITNFEELVPNPARTWPFELDTFQKEAIYHLEQGDSVFVAAHTSAGKTVVAEYAISMAKRNMTKTIYTSPIKALSNQKFRDFKETFEDLDVGLITGDVQINPEANCLIMTTEILRSMLYRGADLIRDVEFVIFDEVHYVNDQDRGVVWEEVIIMLPQHVKFILLSATVPNTYEFASWIGRTKQKNIYVISTPKRPVPLEINIWTKNELIPVITPDREFLEANFKKHKDLLSGDKLVAVNGKSTKEASKGSSRGGRGGTARGGSRGGARSGNRGGSRGAGAVGSNKSQFFRRSGPSKKTWSTLVNYLRKQDLLPMVVFVFSKKRCEEYADWLEGINFCNNREKSQIYMFIEKSITRLKKDDRELPQILKIRSLLERGIAVHHGGLLPIVKELIEILFAKGFIKVLFATETFAMGLNLPTRTVVFSEIQKHDGNGLRDLTPGEFTQMAGRAGRRGLDKTGTVIVMSYTEPLARVSFKEVTLGVPTKLESQFRLTYNMILNLLRIEALKVEEMIKYSFSENTNQTSHPEYEKKIKALEEELEQVRNETCNSCDRDIERLLDVTVRLKQNTVDIMTELTDTPEIFKVLKIGRLVVYRDEEEKHRLGFVFRNDTKTMTCRVLCFTEPNTLPNGEPNYLPYLGKFSSYCKANFEKFKPTEPLFYNIPLISIEYITAYVLKVQFKSFLKKEPDALEEFDKEVSNVIKSSLKLRERKFDIKGNLQLHQNILERENIMRQLISLESYECPRLASHFIPEYKKYKLESEIKQLNHLMSDENLNLLPDYERRLQVLKSTGFIDKHNTVLLKGRVACEINSGYELVLTELILDNFLGDFEPEEIVALLSAFVYEGRTREDEPPIATPRLVKGKKRIVEIYQKMLSVYETHQVPLTQEEAEFLEKKRFALMNVVYEWARGLSFKEIMEISPEAEGTVVRVITWLDEICREVKTASIIIGNSTLHMKMSKAQELIKRDIVFAASLYL